MNIRIIVDSCCDLTEEYRQRIQPLSAPLIVTVGERDYVDDGTVDIPGLIADLASADATAKSTCPSPEAYAAYMRQCESAFVVTLSEKLSGSYNAACLGRQMVLEEQPDKQIHVFDSRSAAAGEAQLALYLQEQIESGLSFDDIVTLGEQYLRKIRTFFVLEDLSNLFKNGRMLHVAGRIASMIQLCPLMGEDGEGHIKLISPSLGIERSLRKLADAVAWYTEGAKQQSVRLILCFCNCLERAEKTKQRLLQKCPALSEVQLVPTGALSTMYANNGGIIVAFHSTKPASTHMFG